MNSTNRFMMVVGIILLGQSTLAQSNFTGLFMPTLALNYKFNEKISQSVELENRNFAYQDNKFGFKVKHLEFGNVTKYQLNSKQQLGFAIRYRFEADGSKENELRLIQQYEWKNKEDAILKHRVRVEERLYNSVTKFRFRYRTGLTFKSDVFCDQIFIANELMTSLTKINKPMYEERIVVEAEWKLFQDTKFMLGTQYRLENFTHQAQHNLYLTTSLSFKL